MASEASDSCLIRKFSNFISLTPSDRTLLKALEKDTRPVRPGQTVRNAGRRVEELYVVGKGWLFSYTDLPDGRRHVLQIHFPGDLIGVNQLPFVQATHDVEAVTDGEICPFPKQGLDAILTQSPRLSALLIGLTLVEQAVALDRFRASARMSARASVAHFLMGIWARLKVTGEERTRFHLPLNQALIGDAVGLTNVSVSKALTRLEREGLIRRDDGMIELKSLAALRNLAAFDDRYASMDTSWFPDAAITEINANGE